MSAPARLAERLARLRWTPHDPSAFLAERSALVREVTMLAVPASPRAIRYEQPDPRADERLRRALALAAARERELAQLRRLLASVRARPRPRRRQPDARQHQLPFHHDGART